MKKILGILIPMLFCTTANAQWSSGPGNLYMVTNGNVGIGTTAPVHNIHIVGMTGAPSIKLENQSPSFGCQLIMTDNNTTVPSDWRFKTASGGQFRIRDEKKTSDVLIFEQRAVTSAPTALYLKSTGELGIGTNTPTQKLDVAGTVRVQNLATGSSSLQLVSADATGVLSGFPFPANANVFLNGSGAFSIPPSGSDADWHDILTDLPPTTLYKNIYTLGNVGIGTSSPVKRVHISSIGNNDGLKLTPRGVSLTGSCIYLDASQNNVLGRDFLIMSTGIGNEQSDVGQFKGQLIFRDLDNFYDIVRMDGNSLNVGIGNINPASQYKLDVDGDIHAYGSINITGTYTGSDSTLKKNISNITNALGTIGQLHPKSFDFRVSEFPCLHLPTEHSYGFIAQDVKTVLPSLLDSIHFAPVRATDSTNTILYAGGSYLSLNYTGMIPFAIKGIQELDSKITDLSAASVTKSCSLTTNYLTKATGTAAVCNSQIYDNGICVGVGTASLPAGYKMVVEGKLGARDVFVACVGWPDYVFGGTYKLKPLDQLESYLSANKHLPGIPSAADIEQAGGLNLGEMQTRQMEKIEELYKYIIEMNKTIQQLGLENKELKERLQKMENK